MQWESESKLRCVTPAGVGSGPVIVTTRSGGPGTCTVEFFFELVREEPEEEEIDMFTEVDVWIEEMNAQARPTVELQTGHSEEDPLRLGIETKQRMSSKVLRTLVIMI